MGTGRDLVAEAERQLGKPYSASIGCRCDNSCPAQDCSGLISGTWNRVTGAHICSSSFGFADWIRRNGLLIAEPQAIHTPGAVGIRNAWGASNGPLGSNGHIVFMKGDGVSTVEEMGTRYGCVRGAATGRNFNAWGLLPGIDYSPPTPPPPVIDWAALAKLAAWRDRLVVHPLHEGDVNADVAILVDLLRQKNYLLPTDHGNVYGPRLSHAVMVWKQNHHWLHPTGTVFGGNAATVILR